MRILIDECLPARLARELAGHEARTVRRMLWTGVKNGELLRLADREFDVFLTIDGSMEHQQVIPANLAFIQPKAASDDIDDLRPLVSAILQALETIQPGDSIHIRS